MGQSRNEDILESMIAGEEYYDVPKSREEYLLLQLKEVIEQGGTTNYNLLTNKPRINGVELSGNKSLSDIGAQDTLTSAQLAATDSGITSAKVAQYDNVLAVFDYNTLNHNGIFRGKDLTSQWVDGGKIKEALYTKVHAGDFSDLYLGDYFTVHIDTNLYEIFTGTEFGDGATYYEQGGTVLDRTYTRTVDTSPETGKKYYTKRQVSEDVSLMIAAFNYYYNNGTDVPHIIFVLKAGGLKRRSAMNPTDTTVGAYYNSYMHQTVLPCYASSFKVALGNHLLPRRTMMPTTINASTPSMAGAGLKGASSNIEAKTVELQLISEMQLTGGMIWSSSAYDVGTDTLKLPIFNFITPHAFSKEWFWLRTVVSDINFGFYSIDGAVVGSRATNTAAVNPLIVFG